MLETREHRSSNARSIYTLHIRKYVATRLLTHTHFLLPAIYYIPICISIYIIYPCIVYSSSPYRTRSRIPTQREPRALGSDPDETQNENPEHHHHCALLWGSGVNAHVWVKILFIHIRKSVYKKGQCLRVCEFGIFFLGSFGKRFGFGCYMSIYAERQRRQHKHQMHVIMDIATVES